MRRELLVPSERTIIRSELLKRGELSLTLKSQLKQCLSDLTKFKCSLMTVSLCCFCT